MMENELVIEAHLVGALTNLLETLNDKDENVRNSIEGALIKISKKYPNEVLQILCAYKKKHQKLGESQTAILLRIIENTTTSDLKLRDDIIKSIIELSISELTKNQDNCVLLQKPSLEILVSLGRNDCSLVMDNLIKQLQPGHVGHFMILHCMGTLATANITGIIKFIKPVFELLLPTLGTIKQDYIKQAYSFAIGRFSEAIMENVSNNTSNLIDDFGTQISIAYDILLNYWLPSREPKVCCDILFALSLMFPILPQDKIREQIPKVITLLLNLYRRSIDRISITQLLASVIKSSIKMDPRLLDVHSDHLINSLFDLVCVTPDYEKPQTVKGHYEVLRCFDLLFAIHGDKIMDMILVQLRNNNERERIKSLLLLTHLTNTSDSNVSTKLKDVQQLLKIMITLEKSIKLKMILLKTIVAFAQKNFIEDPEFIKFILRHCCHYNKIALDYGTANEYNNLYDACNNSMFILSSTMGTIDDLLKQELLYYFMQTDYIDACPTIAKCLANLFAKNNQINLKEIPAIPDINSSNEVDMIKRIPSSSAIFVRCLILLGNFNEKKRSHNILEFLKSYCINVNKHLLLLWNDKIPELITSLDLDNDKIYFAKLYNFFTLTLRDIDDIKYNELVLTNLSEQIPVYYNATIQNTEFRTPVMSVERGMALKLLGLNLCSTQNPELINNNIDLILNTSRLEKLEKNIPQSNFEYRLSDAAKSFGFVSKIHYELLIKRFENLINDEYGTTTGKKSNFFSNFIRDAQKEIDTYKMKLLIVETFGFIVTDGPKDKIFENIDEIMIKYLLKQLMETKDFTLKKLTIQTLLIIAVEYLKVGDKNNFELKSRSDILKMIIKIEIAPFQENIPLFPLIIKLATFLIKIPNASYDDISEYLHLFSCNFFTCAQQLKSKFNSIEDDEKNSLLAKYINQSLPELNLFIRTFIELNPSPASLDDIYSILEIWLKDKNNEVRICAGHVLNNSLDVYIKTMKIGCEAPSKFNQTGSMLGKIVPRCIDSNATVRQTSIDILRKILEIACVYDTLTIADNTIDWVMDLQNIHDEIVTDDPREIYRFAGEIAKVIGNRLSNFQYLHFCKSLLYCLNDPEQSSAIGTSVVLKFFIQNKGSELFHAVPELVKESLHVVKYCENTRAKSGVLKSLIALTKHHPKIVCSEILNQKLPLEEHIIEYWQMMSFDLELSGIVIDNFLGILNSSCLYEHDDGNDNRQKIATVQPFSIICALKELFQITEITPELKSRFSEILTVLLTSLASYTNVAPPIISGKVINPKVIGTAKQNSKFSFIPNKESAKMNPCLVVLETFIAFLDRLNMEQVILALNSCSTLSTSPDLRAFIEILTPLAIGLVNQLEVNSSSMKHLVTALNKYISSPYDPQRIAAIGFYSQLVPLKPFGEISSVIILHLHSSLNDPNPLVRGFCIRGLAFVGNLSDHDIEKYSELCLTSLLKGIDDYNGDCLINIPLESMRGLSRILKTISCAKFDMFQVSMSIRIRAFFENNSLEIREAAIVLFGDLCETKLDSSDQDNSNKISDSLKEQIYANLISIILHLSETDDRIKRACKFALKGMCSLMKKPKINQYIHDTLHDNMQFNYDDFITELIKLFGEEINDSISDFIESCLPYTKSNWLEIRANAAIIIGLLYNHNKTNQQQDISSKISALLRDENNYVKIKASKSLGYLFGDI